LRPGFAVSLRSARQEHAIIQARSMCFVFDAVAFGTPSTTFDPAGSVDTNPYGINTHQSVAGYYKDTGG
jgi:hypothetical protein